MHRFFEVSVMFPNLDQWYTMAIKAIRKPSDREALAFVKTITKEKNIVGVEILEELNLEDVLLNFHHDTIKEWSVFGA